MQEDEDQVQSGNSLSARMDQRAEVLEQQVSEIFPIPGYENIIEVELRALGYKRIRQIQKRNEKVRDEVVREIYSIADQVIAATIGFYEVNPNGTRSAIEDDWVSLAKRRRGCPDAPTPRQALLFLVTDKRIHFFADDWGTWARSVRADVDEELAEDFATTG